MTEVIEVRKVKVKDILTELKRTGGTFKYVAQGYYMPPNNEYNTRTFFNKQSGEDEEVTKSSYALPNRDERTILYLNPFTRAHTQFTQYLALSEDVPGALKNREITITFRARLSANQDSQKKGLYVLEAQFEVGTKTFDIVGFPENMENSGVPSSQDLTHSISSIFSSRPPSPTSGSATPEAKPAPKPAPSPEAKQAPQQNDTITAATRKKLTDYLASNGLAIPVALSQGTMSEVKAKNLLIALMSE
ncbi:MAG: hypothetical protein QXL94_00290 [Candidatus Parvarchaeum sp.]